MGAIETVRNVIGGDGSERLLRSNGTVSDSHECDVAAVGAVGRGVDTAIGGNKRLYGRDCIDRGNIEVNGRHRFCTNCYDDYFNNFGSLSSSLS